jgi:hypothetical protein
LNLEVGVDNEAMRLHVIVQSDELFNRINIRPSCHHIIPHRPSAKCQFT